MLNVEEVADLVGLKRQTVYVYRYRGTLPAADEMRGDRPFWLESTIVDWARGNKVGRFKYE